jgi:hypothetical protein
MSEREIRRCPFCGSLARVAAIADKPGYPPGAHHAYVACLSCPANMREGYGGEDRDEAVKRAVAAWNRDPPKELHRDAPDFLDQA